MRRQVILFGCAALLVLVSGSYAQDKQPSIGVLLDGTPLPELLAKHLVLEPGQGLRVVNISVGSAAEKAGLDRDDIIIAFQGQKVTDLDLFLEEVKKAGVGARVSLEVIHLGQRKTVQLQLEPLGKKDWSEVEWKYPPEPPEPESVTLFRPGNIWKIGPNGERLQIPFDQLRDLDFDFNKIFRETYTYKHMVDGQECTITIEGDPAEADTRVVVHAGGAEYSATVGEIDALPEKYRDSVKQDVNHAKENFHITRSLRLPEMSQPDMQKFFGSLPRLNMERLNEEKDRTIEKLQEQMERMQQRMQQLEEKLLNKKSDAEPKSDKTEQSAPAQTDEKLSV